MITLKILLLVGLVKVAKGEYKKLMASFSAMMVESREQEIQERVRAAKAQVALNKVRNDWYKSLRGGK